MPLFSVIIPVFNAAQTLPETLRSLEKQSFKDFDVIIVNDGSTDNSLENLKIETADWENVTLLNQQNHGLGMARNTAAKAATGEWLVFLDADDYWASDKLQVLAMALETQPNTQFIYHAIFEKYPNGMMRKRRFKPIQNLDQFIRLGNPFVPSAVAIKREVFLKNGGFIEDRNEVEDLLLWFRLLKAKINLLPIKRPLTVYRVGAGVTAKLEEHLQKVEHALTKALQAGMLTAAECDAFREHKNYEAARQLHKLGNHELAANYYTRSNKSSLKFRMLRQLNKLGIAV